MSQHNFDNEVAGNEDHEDNGGNPTQWETIDKKSARVTFAFKKKINGSSNGAELNESEKTRQALRTAALESRLDTPPLPQVILHGRGHPLDHPEKSIGR